MPEPWLATENINLGPSGTLAFTPGQVVPDSWVDDHPEFAGSVARRTPELVDEVVPGAYDPGFYTVDAVKAHLETVTDPAERARIVAAEQAGQARKGITDLALEA